MEREGEREKEGGILRVKNVTEGNKEDIKRHCWQNRGPYSHFLFHGVMVGIA